MQNHEEKEIIEQTAASAEEKRMLARRKFLSGSGFLATGALLAGAMTNLAKPQAALGQESPVTPPTWPYPFQQLDPELAAELGYQGYFEGGCCYGGIKAIVGQLAQLYGNPYDLIPLDMFRYGEGGVAGWSSVCGTINGSAAAINLLCPMDVARNLINELIAWYCDTPLPTYVPDGKEAIVMNSAGSPLCHVSVSLWCKEAKAGASSNERKERCARLVADVAYKTAELLNQQFKGEFVAEHGPAESVGECMTCHGSTVLNNTIGKMDCQQCHGDPHNTAPINGWDNL